MTNNSRLAPEDSFPDELHSLGDEAVEVLNSKVHRQLDAEYVDSGEPHPETEFRLDELTEELDRRDDDAASGLVNQVRRLATGNPQ